MSDGVKLHIEDVPMIFRAVRAYEDNAQIPTPVRRRVLSDPGRLLLVETLEEHPVGSIKPCKVLTGPQGSESQSAETLPCFNRFRDLASGKQALAGEVNNGWELIENPPIEDLFIEGYLLADLTSGAASLMRVYHVVDSEFVDAGYSVMIRARGGIIGSTGAYCVCVQIRGEWRPVFVGCV